MTDTVPGRGSHVSRYTISTDIRCGLVPSTRRVEASCRGNSRSYGHTVYERWKWNHLTLSGILAKAETEAGATSRSEADIGREPGNIKWETTAEGG